MFHLLNYVLGDLWPQCVWNSTVTLFFVECVLLQDWSTQDKLHLRLCVSMFSRAVVTDKVCTRLSASLAFSAQTSVCNWCRHSRRLHRPHMRSHTSHPHTTSRLNEVSFKLLGVFFPCSHHSCDASSFCFPEAYLQHNNSSMGGRFNF